nr:unnamed protein product [Spirometra erinaceieuropaei]
MISPDAARAECYEELLALLASVPKVDKSSVLGDFNNSVVVAATTDKNDFVQNQWCQLRDIVQPTALAVLRRTGRQNQDRFDDNDAAISNILVEENRLLNVHVYHPTGDNEAAFYRSRRLVQQRLQEILDAWTARKAEEIQGYVDRNEWSNLIFAIKDVNGQTAKGTSPLLNADQSMLLTENGNLLKRLADFLTGRSQRVCIGNTKSEWAAVPNDVPQVSVLDPVLCSIYVNDCLGCLNCEHVMFADDLIM